MLRPLAHARRSQRDHSRSVCGRLHPAVDLCAHRGAAVLQEGRHGQLRLQKVTRAPSPPTLEASVPGQTSTGRTLPSLPRKVHSAPDRPDRVFQEQGVSGRPQISPPTFMASTATQACAPLMVSAPPRAAAPQVPTRRGSTGEVITKYSDTYEPLPFRSRRRLRPQSLPKRRPQRRPQRRSVFLLWTNVK